MSKWTRITEDRATWPPKDTYVLVRDEGYEEFFVGEYDTRLNGEWRIPARSPDAYFPFTHEDVVNYPYWQPLPGPPEREEEECNSKA